MNYYLLFFCYLNGDHRDLHVLTHSFPTRRSSDLTSLRAVMSSVMSNAFSSQSSYEMIGSSRWAAACARLLLRAVSEQIASVRSLTGASMTDQPRWRASWA